MHLSDKGLSHGDVVGLQDNLCLDFLYMFLLGPVQDWNQESRFTKGKQKKSKMVSLRGKKRKKKKKIPRMDSAEALSMPGVRNSVHHTWSHRDLPLKENLHVSKSLETKLEDCYSVEMRGVIVVEI